MKVDWRSTTIEFGAQSAVMALITEMRELLAAVLVMGWLLYMLLIPLPRKEVSASGLFVGRVVGLSVN